VPFNSYLFLFLFLPAALTAYHAVSLTRLHALRLPVLIVATIAFYALGAARFLPLLLASVALNFLLARLMLRFQGRSRTWLLALGVGGNLAALIYFKFAGFLVANITGLFGHPAALPPVVLPLAISFYSFQQIAFLVDTARGLVPPARPLIYAASILFFPYIISGPITLYREVAPQLAERPPARHIAHHLLVGLILFALGLFKKTVIADSFALWVDPGFTAAAHGTPIGLAGAWTLVASYLLQMYFDFSGYSDMAIGLARMFGITLPLNFFSPIRATSIIEWWRRWHMTLGRFANLYVFQPLALPLTRWSIARDHGRWGVAAAGTLLPTFVTMLVIGVWHGGNWTFVVFGLLHGTFMVVAESWRFAMRKRRRGKTARPWEMALGNIATLAAVLVALAPFRAPEMATAARLWQAMAGLDGAGSSLAAGQAAMLGTVALGFAFAYLMPNSEQFMTRIAPALEWRKWEAVSPAVIALRWRATTAWSIALGALLLIAIAFVGRGSTSFVYFGF
jgi:D-alanyl-lipoteichoic acid acyltransferase DltB (MBOAT superfamily)